jgi:hypothetical protein
MVGVAQRLERLTVAQKVGGSIPLTHPNYYPHANRGSCEPQEREGFNLSEGENDPTPSEMVNFTRYLQKYADIQPRTYWWEFSFYTIIKSFRQKYCLGERPEDLNHIATIEQRTWEKHLTHLNRLERFPLDKAEYYLRLKESQGVNSIRGLAKITGEDWSYVAKIIRTLELAEPIKEFLRSNKNDPAILQFFHLRKLLDIVRQGEERQQLTRFRGMIEELEGRGDLK